jgi:hypothetical protein
MKAVAQLCNKFQFPLKAVPTLRKYLLRLLTAKTREPPGEGRRRGKRGSIHPLFGKDGQLTAFSGESADKHDRTTDAGKGLNSAPFRERSAILWDDASRQLATGTLWGKPAEFSVFRATPRHSRRVRLQT